MSILDISRDERPNVATVTVKHAANEKIANDVDAFLARGGRINQIPTGQSGINTAVKAFKKSSGGTGYRFVDESLKINSADGRAATLRKRQIKEAEAKARKR